MTPTSTYFTDDLMVIISQHLFFCVQKLETCPSSAFYAEGLYGLLLRYVTVNEVKQVYFQSIRTVK